MRKLDFYGLPRSLQDRFIESSRGAAVPAPLAAVSTPSGRPLRWGLGALGALAGWMAFTSLGFGDLSSPLALGSKLYVAVHVSFAAAVVYCALRSYGSSWEAGRAFVVEGKYLFPSGVIEASGTELVEHDSRALSGAQVEGTNLVVSGDGQRFVFPVGSADRARELSDAYAAGRERWMALADGEALERARLHALVESGVPNPLAPTQAHRRPVFLGPAVLGLLTVVVASVFGCAVWSLRNSFSEKELYRAAVQANTVASYQAYLARGGERADVAQLFLPRARLEQAMRERTVEAIERFISANPNTKIGSEVAAVHRAALLGVLAEAQKAGTLAAIEDVRKKYPAHTLIEPELAAARKAAFTRALAAFRAEASTKNAELLPFVEQLLAYTEAHGPVVEIRFAHDFPQSKEMLDSIVSKSEKYYLGRKSLPTQYFLGEAARVREQKLAELLVQRFARSFPSDVLRFQLASPSTGENVELPAITVPTLTITHKESLSGAFVGGKPKSVFLGATVVLNARLQLPGDEQLAPLKYVYSAWRAPNFNVLIEKDIPDVYEDMMWGAFQGFSEAYLATWFESP
ncbi:MAG TPA: hypothetical protein VLC09_14120 [Polyangiaceae bacterium]|nr:hypothetical protein [Polyangiaceae bacterium]